MNKKFIFTMFGCLIVSFMVLNAKYVFTQGTYDIKEMTADVKAALDHRKDRFDEIRALKSQGVIGENNRGYLEVLGTDARASVLAAAENTDRKLIYRAIEQQNNLTNALATIEKVFAQVQRDKALTGDRIQNEAGNWMTK